MIKISIANDFSDSLGGRFINEGNFSGEEFREKILIPKYREAVENGALLEIDFDGCFGFPSSFIDEAFGGLARIEKSNEILRNIVFVSNDEPKLIEKIEKCIKEAKYSAGDKIE